MGLEETAQLCGHHLHWNGLVQGAVPQGTVLEWQGSCVVVGRGCSTTVGTLAMR